MVSTVIYDTLASEIIIPIAVVGLIILLVARELATASESPTAQRLGQFIGVFTVPLLLVFAFVVIQTVIDVVS